MTSLSSSGIALETTAGGADLGIIPENMAHDAKFALLTSMLQKVLNCGDKNKIYNPTWPTADPDGCVDPMGASVTRWRVTFTSITGGVDNITILSEMNFLKGSVETTPIELHGAGGAVGDLESLFDDNIATTSAAHYKNSPQSITADFAGCQSFDKLILNAAAGGGYTPRTYTGSISYSLDRGVTWTQVKSFAAVTPPVGGSNATITWADPAFCD